ncbi:DoxX family protein [Sphingomonas sp. S2-65]|uniref:DoxX family protein n=1 Tax=Sphingomonas sp. S2-65 TaxID=2903960 RepID=UPI001F19CB5A|nr:DoxX family protein [Sphingomonas sp. S2-65]UYY58420.1 DoxX family protein [Sphingomonas sp. S2-65]
MADTPAGYDGSAGACGGNSIALRHEQALRMETEDKPERPPSFLSLLIESMAAAGCALYPSSASITLMVEIEAQRERRRRERLALKQENNMEQARTTTELSMNTVVERLLKLPMVEMIARIVLTFPFWESGLAKIINFTAGVAEMAHFGLEPAPAFNIATVIVQLGGSMLIILGRYAWLGAGALGVFTGLTIVLVHRFWAIAEDPFRTIAFHTATEHVGMIGGLLAIAILTTRSRAE